MKRTIHSKYLFHGVELPSTYVPPIIVAYNIRTPENVGSIIRLADNIVCDKVLFVSDSNDIRESKIKKTAASSFKSVNWKFCTQAELDNEIPDDYNLVAIETTSDSENIYQAKLQSKVAFVVGNEVAGVDDTFLDRCSKIVHIPIYGKNTSLNVSHALALALFEWQRQMVL
ncbi:MAG: TrmH family RNA methyltransferase [Bacteroidales bacterium]|nr:TrmH family RNA methyltransferase [Bacteroidales bacterium]